jgi:hypothetical protein
MKAGAGKADGYAETVYPAALIKYRPAAGINKEHLYHLTFHYKKRGTYYYAELPAYVHIKYPRPYTGDIYVN